MSDHAGSCGIQHSLRVWPSGTWLTNTYIFTLGSCEDTLIEVQKTLVGEKDTLIEELESERVHVVAPSSLSSLFSSIQGCFHEHAKVRIRMFMEAALNGVPKWFKMMEKIIQCHFPHRSINDRNSINILHHR
jgi:hypothetical protein